MNRIKKELRNVLFIHIICFQLASLNYLAQVKNSAGLSQLVHESFRVGFKDMWWGVLLIAPFYMAYIITVIEKQFQKKNETKQVVQS